MTEINEARKNLESQLGEDLMKQYLAILKQWFLFKDPITRLQFDGAVTKLLKTKDQLWCHNAFLLALLAKVTSSRAKGARGGAADRGSFELADYAPPSPAMLPPEFEARSAASELFLPDSGFVATRIAIHAWENGLEGADDSVSDYLIQASQIYIKNIVTAIISRKESYKVRDGKFQHSFRVPVPDPFIRNSNNLFDGNQEAKVEVAEDDDSFAPIPRNSVERAEQEAAFSYSCASKKPRSDNKLTVKLLYDTLKENGSVVGLHSIHSLNLLRIGLYVDDS